MTDFKTIGELPVTTTLTDNDKFIVETATGTKAVTRSALKEEAEIPTKADIGLGNVDNTSDLNKPISTATQTALDGKVDTSTYSTLVSTTLPSTYLSQTDAASTYLAQNTASGTYLSKNDAANYYIAQENAGSLFVSQTSATTISALGTTAKTVTGAINELNTTLSGVETLLSQV